MSQSPHQPSQQPEFWNQATVIQSLLHGKGMLKRILLRGNDATMKEVIRLLQNILRAAPPEIRFDRHSNHLRTIIEILKNVVHIDSMAKEDSSALEDISEDEVSPTHSPVKAPEVTHSPATPSPIKPSQVMPRSDDSQNTDITSPSERDDFDSFAGARRRAIEETIIGNSGNFPTFSEIAGLQEAKNAIIEALIDPIRYPEYFKTGDLKPWKSVLLYGPPGTGKTILSQAVVKEIDGVLYQISPSALISAWQGQSEKLIKELFDHAFTVVIFIDEVDSLCRTRSKSEDDATRRVKTEILVQVQRLQSTEGVILMCATNCPWELDPAFLRRFEKRIYAGLPDLEARLEILRTKLKPDITISTLSERTAGLSGDDLRRLASELAYEQFRKYKNSTPRAGSQRNRRIEPLNMEDVNGVLKQFQPSVDSQQLALFEKFMNKRKMDQEIREARRVFRRAFQLGQDAYRRTAQAVSNIPIYTFYLMSFAATGIVISAAYMKHGQFYTAMMDIWSSKVSLMILDMQFLVFFYLIYKLLVHVFFNPMTAVEVQNLQETTWYETLESLIFLTLFKGEFSHIFVCEILVMILMKSLLSVANLRINGYAVVRDTSIYNHAKVLLLLPIGFIVSGMLLYRAFEEVMTNGSVHQIVMGVEHFHVLVFISHSVFKYGLFKYCQRRPMFYRKEEYLKCAEVISCLIRFISYFSMILLLSTYDSIPYLLLRNLYQSMKDFTESFDTWRKARNAVRVIEENIFDITPEQLEQLEDRMCAICRDEMTLETRQRRLNCGHCFHVQCMRDWFQRQPRCPTCRADVVRVPPPNSNSNPTASGGAAAGGNQQRNGNDQVNAEMARLPPEVVAVLNRLARLANDAVGNNDENEGLQDNGEEIHDVNVHITITQNTYQQGAHNAAANAIPPPLPLPNGLLETMSVNQLMELGDNMMESLHLRMDARRNLLQTLLHGRRSMLQQIMTVQSVLEQIFTHVRRMQGNMHILEQNNVELYEATLVRVHELVQTVRRISREVNDELIQGYASSTRDASTQSTPRTESTARRRLFGQYEVNNQRTPAPRSYSDETVGNNRRQGIRLPGDGHRLTGELDSFPPIRGLMDRSSLSPSWRTSGTAPQRSPQGVVDSLRSTWEFDEQEEDDTVVVRRRRPLDTVVIIGQNSEVLEQNLSQTNNSSRQGQN